VRCEVKMSMKMECNSCGYAELVSDRRLKSCPECGATDIEFESDPLAESGAVAEAEHNADPEVGLRAPSRPVPKSPRSGSGIGAGMSSGTQIRIIFGLIGFILLMSGVGMISTGGLGGNFMVMITLMVIGFIFLAIATKGEICCSC